MNEPIVFKRSVLVGQLVLIQVLVPPLLAIGTLYGLAFLYGAQFRGELRVLAVLVAILAPMVFKRPELSTLTILPRWGTIAFSLILRWLVLLALLFAIGYATKTSAEFPRRVVLTWAFVTPIPLIFVSIAVNEIVRRFMLAPSNIRAAVVAGYNDVSQVLLQRIKADPGLGLRVAGFFDDRSVERLGLSESGGLLGGLSDLPVYVQTHRTDVIFISLPMRQVQRVVDLLDELRDTTASIYFVPDIFVMDLIQSRTADISGVPVVAMCETPFQGSRGVIKRLMDVGISVVALIAAVAVPAFHRPPDQAQFAGPDHLPPAPLRPRRADHRCPQVPHDDGDRRRRPHQAGDAQRRAVHADWQVPEESLDRRAAPALQCA